MLFKKYRNAMAKSRVVKNQSADVGEIFVRNVNVKAAGRFGIGAHMREYSKLTR